MSPARRQAIARKGAKALHAQGKQHEFTSDEAREAALDRHYPKVRETEEGAETVGS